MVGVDPHALSVLWDAVILRVQKFHDHVVTQAREFPHNRLEGLSMTVCPQALYVFEEDVLRSLGLADSDDVVEKGTPGVVFTFTKANLREWLAGEAARKDVEVWQGLRVDGCDVTEEGHSFVVLLV